MNRQPSESDVGVFVSSHDLDDYDILSSMTLSVAVPYRTTESFRKVIWAAMTTYGLGNSSVDHVLRRYGHLWDSRSDKSFQRDSRIVALRTVCDTVDKISHALEEQQVERRLGPICAKAALCRLEASFKAAFGLVRRGYIFETDAVARLILEQLAWAFAAHAQSDEAIFRLPATKCISTLKSAFPDVGVLYGTLSEWAHIDPSIARNYVDFHVAGVDVVRRGAFNSFESGATIALLAPLYLDVAQRLFAPFSLERCTELRKLLSELHVQYASGAESADDQ